MKKLLLYSFPYFLIVLWNFVDFMRHIEAGKYGNATSDVLLMLIFCTMIAFNISCYRSGERILYGWSSIFFIGYLVSMVFCAVLFVFVIVAAFQETESLSQLLVVDISLFLVSYLCKMMHDAIDRREKRSFEADKLRGEKEL